MDAYVVFAWYSDSSGAPYPLAVCGSADEASAVAQMVETASPMMRVTFSGPVPTVAIAAQRKEGE